MLIDSLHRGNLANTSGRGFTPFRRRIRAQRFSDLKLRDEFPLSSTRIFRVLPVVQNVLFLVSFSSAMIQIIFYTEESPNAYFSTRYWIE